MKVSVIGAGYVGLVSASCLSDCGHNVVCIDSNANKIKDLKSGIIDIYEPGLKEIVEKNLNSKHLYFSDDIEDALEEDIGIIFVAVDTPPNKDGSSDLTNILKVATSIGEKINSKKIIAIKSTVPVGTSEIVEEEINAILKNRGLSFKISVCSNPEFLKEGSAIQDFTKPDRIIIGTQDDEIRRSMEECYAPFNRQKNRLVFMARRSSELTKYAANAMLATKISFINELSRIAELLGVDIEDVRNGIGSDSRIGTNFLYPGCGFGGSCFPKDLDSIIHVSQSEGYEPKLLSSVSSINEEQKKILFNKLNLALEGDIKGKKIAVWGLSFKPETDDMRLAPSIELMNSIWQAGGIVNAYDPQANETAKKLFLDRKDFNLFSNHLDVLEDCSALVICTEWKIFRSLDLKEISRRLIKNIIIDGRNIYNPNLFEGTNFDYYGIARGKSIEK